MKRLFHSPEPKTLMTSLTTSMLLALLIAYPVALAEESGLDTEEATTPTPLSEFAPDEVRPARNQVYDQGVSISKISIEGNHLIQEEQIRQNMVIRPGSLYSKKNLRDDLRRIYDMGYFTEKIKAVPIATNQGIHLRIVVEENAPVTGVHIDGNTLIDESELQQIFAGQTGLPQNIGQLNESIEQVEKLYADKGYILARVTSIADDPDGVINLKINEGKINQVRVVGNRKTKDFVIKRAMVLKEGDVYNEKLLSEDLKRVFGTQAFSDVRRVITASPENPDQYNLTIEVDEKRTGSISLGGGLDTGTGIFGSVGYTDPNFLGRGQNFSSVAAVGSGIISRDRSSQANTRNYQFEVNWSEPSLFQTNNSLAVSAYGRDYASFNVPLGIERRIGTQVSWARPLESMKNTSISLGLGGERVSMRDWASDRRVRELGFTASERDQQLEGGTFITLSPTLAYDTRDNRFNPTSGWLATLSTTGAYGIGTDSYGVASANIRKYFKIRDGITLALNAQGGQALLGDMPEFNMFRLGGAYSVRGFQEGGLGTGQGYLLGSAELRAKVPMLEKLKNVPVLDSLMAVAFLDAGTLMDESFTNSRLDRSGMGIASGLGLRINIPGLGPIRIDYAIPLSSGGDYTRRFNFGVGQKF